MLFLFLQDGWMHYTDDNTASFERFIHIYCTTDYYGIRPKLFKLSIILALLWHLLSTFNLIKSGGVICSSSKLHAVISGWYASRLLSREGDDVFYSMID